MNTAKIGQEIAIVKDTKTPASFYITDEEDDNNTFFQSFTLKNGRFQVVPDKKKDRTSIFIVGRNGSGKSYWIHDYIMEYKKRFPTRKIRLFSSKDEDTNLDKIKDIIRVKIDDSFVSNPLDYEALTESLAIFDDIDAFKGDLKKEIYYLRDIILKNGRSYKIDIISTNHDCTGRDIQAPLNESDIIVFFMKNYNRSLKYLLENYIGVDKDATKILRKNKTRATSYIKTYPNVIVQEQNIYTLEGLNQQAEKQKDKKKNPK